MRQQLDGYVKLWKDEPLTISIDSTSFGFHARVVQYEFQSLDALKAKLAQFASGSKFALIISTTEPSAVETAAELRSFLITHGMSVTNDRGVK